MAKTWEKEEIVGAKAKQIVATKKNPTNNLSSFENVGGILSRLSSFLSSIFTKIKVFILFS
ncbi:MAG TPA: hypothetical protein PLO44_00860 [Candidatus Paceibacterota bacterium]|nr:hypothetical protein [Candidatus Paceibacterota bacterium]